MSMFISTLITLTSYVLVVVVVVVVVAEDIVRVFCLRAHTHCGIRCGAKTLTTMVVVRDTNMFVC